MDDPDFWSKVLGEDEGGVVGMDGVDDYGGEFEYDNDGQVAQRRSRRSSAAPARLAPSWGVDEDSNLLALLKQQGEAGGSADAGGSGSKEGGKEGEGAVAKKAKKSEWGRPQLNALYAGLFAYGYGRVGKVQSMHPTLSAKGLPELERARVHRGACSAYGRQAVRREQ